MDSRTAYVVELNWRSLSIAEVTVEAETEVWYYLKPSVNACDALYRDIVGEVLYPYRRSLPKTTTHLYRSYGEAIDAGITFLKERIAKARNDIARCEEWRDRLGRELEAQIAKEPS